jgi:hypothetical protein
LRRLSSRLGSGGSDAANTAAKYDDEDDDDEDDEDEVEDKEDTAAGVVLAVGRVLGWSKMPVGFRVIGCGC